MKEMTDKLTPVRCGCGGEAWTDYIIGEPSEGVGWFVCCKNCEIQLPAEYSTEAEAVQAWNRAMGAKDINVPNKFATDMNVGDKERTAKVIEHDGVVTMDGRKYHHMEYFESGGR